MNEQKRKSKLSSLPIHGSHYTETIYWVLINVPNTLSPIRVDLWPFIMISRIRRKYWYSIGNLFPHSLLLLLLSCGDLTKLWVWLLNYLLISSRCACPRNFVIKIQIRCVQAVNFNPAINSLISGPSKEHRWSSFFCTFQMIMLMMTNSRQKKTLLSAVLREKSCDVWRKSIRTAYTAAMAW